MAVCPHCLFHCDTNASDCGACRSLADQHGVPVAVVQEALGLVGDEDGPMLLGHAIDLILHNAV